MSPPVAPLGVPRATYRLQFHAGFTFEDAEKLVPYLDALGISHIYASPYLRARAGSMHGYDIIDHATFNPEVGNRDTFLAFSDALKKRGMSQILDFVPNHMGVAYADNAWWLDVLEWGEESPFASYFDIDWNPAKAELKGKVLVPVLGDHYGDVLENGELELQFDPDFGTFSVWYYEHRLPVMPGSYAMLLDRAFKRLESALKSSDTVLVELELIIPGFRDLKRVARSARHRSIRHAKAARLKQQLADLARQSPGLREAIVEALNEINGVKGKPESFAALHALLERQNYRAAFWRVAAEEINYRRFFQINELAGIRVEQPEVFDATHRFVLELIGAGHLSGLRIDHIDGLFAPRRYLERLQEKAAAARGSASAGSEGAGGGASGDLYVVVEKILAPHENLREDWRVAGTTGYDFLHRINGLFVDSTGEAPLTRAYHRFVGEPREFEEMIYETKKQAMDQELASELRVLANEFNRFTETDWTIRDYTLVGLRQALREVVACFPVYRTYVGKRGATANDERDLDWAVAHARRRSKRTDKSIFDIIHRILTTELGRERRHRRRRLEIQRLARKFQQYTGPVMAKGVEDTAFYRYNRLVSLNEVGGEPSRFGTSVAAFHRWNQDQQRHWPHAMLSTATHDTKRGEDARLRISVLSEMPSEWATKTRRWAVLNRMRKADLDGGKAPSSEDEYLFYQTLVGSWPVEFHGVETFDAAAMETYRERIVAYMLKAVREAKRHSSWISPDSAYEGALTDFITRVLDGDTRHPFLGDFSAFHARIAELGMLSGLSQITLKLTAPGVPDIYQGCDGWDLSLVDPDNRRPVDFEARIAQLRDLETQFGKDAGGRPRELLSHWRDGQVKLFVLWRLLSIRRREPDLFSAGDYVPLDLAGPRSNQLCAFLRSRGDAAMLVVVPRLLAGIAEAGPDWRVGGRLWDDTRIGLPEAAAERKWRNVFTGAHAAIERGEGPAAISAAAIGDFPVAVMLAEGDAASA